MKQYIVDAFTDQLFHGNPAAVCVLEQWLSDETMMHIAEENHLSETAFVVKAGKGYRLRWFTPGGRNRPLRSRDACLCFCAFE